MVSLNFKLFIVNRKKNTKNIKEGILIQLKFQLNNNVKAD